MPVELLNPLNAEQSIMRQSIIPGLLHSLAYNQNHGVKNVQLYETGRVFFAAEGKKKQMCIRDRPNIVRESIGQTNETRQSLYLS